MKNRKIASLLLAAVMLLGLLPGTAFAAEPEFGWIAFNVENYQGQKVVTGVQFDWIGEMDDMQLSDITDYSLTRDGEPVDVRLIETADTLNRRNQWWSDTDSGTSFKFDFSEKLTEPGWYDLTFTYKGQTYTSGYPFYESSDSEPNEPDDAILIGSEAELRAFAESVNRGDYYDGHLAYVKLTRDIELTDGEWTPIGKQVDLGDGGTTTYGFYGTFDGNGHSITGIKIGSKENPSALEYIGFFMEAPQNVFELSLEVEIYAAPGDWDSVRHIIGGLAARGFGEIRNCRVSGYIEIDGFSMGAVGGLLGEANKQAVVRDCRSSMTIRSQCVDAGGLIGWSGASVIGCGASGDVSGLHAGGLIGSAEGYIESCYATGNVTTVTVVDTTHGYESTSEGIAGGLIGGIFAGSAEKDPLIIRNSFAGGNVADLSGDKSSYFSSAGGFIGSCDVNNGSIENCYALGDVSGPSAGGFMGNMNPSLYSTNDSAQKPFLISHCFAAGNVTSETGYAAGFAVTSDARITDCAALGDVTALSYAMGFANTNNYANVLTERCYSKGNVVSTSDEYGGAIAFGNGKVSNCYAFGNASGYEAYAFLDGYNCYFTGVLSGENSDNKVSGENCYGDMTVFPDGYTDTSTGKTTAEMQSQAVVDLLNAGQADKPWKYKAGSYPMLSYNLLPVGASSSAGGTLYAPPYASAGDEVVLFAVPDEGYVLTTLSLNGAAIEGSSFVMPDGDVTVSAGFEPVSASVGETPNIAPGQTDGNSSTPAPSQNGENNPDDLPWLIIVIAVVLIAGGGVFFVLRRKKQSGKDK